eukprot:4367005-Pleurochrysis_carterae.AAC.1
MQCQGTSIRRPRGIETIFCHMQLFLVTMKAAPTLRERPFTVHNDEAGLHVKSAPQSTSATCSQESDA